MKAEVKSIVFADAERDRIPVGESNFMTLAMIIAGPRGEPGEESFQVEVCTPAWIAERVDSVGPLVGRHHLIVKNWDEQFIRTVLISLFEGEEAPTWAELGERLGRLGMWEFEDYRP